MAGGFVSRRGWLFMKSSSCPRFALFFGNPVICNAITKTIQFKVNSYLAPFSERSRLPRIDESPSPTLKPASINVAAPWFGLGVDSLIETKPDTRKRRCLSHFCKPRRILVSFASIRCDCRAPLPRTKSANSCALPTKYPMPSSKRFFDHSRRHSQRALPTVCFVDSNRSKSRTPCGQVFPRTSGGKIYHMRIHAG